MSNYTQEYQYDEIGNLIQIACPELDSGKSNGIWTRDYQYNFDLNSGGNNYLFNHDLNSTTADYLYDVHGNMTKLPHLQELFWDYADQLKEVTLDTSGNTAYYVYDTGGNRVRKVVVKNNGTIVENRFYVGNYEIFSKTVNNVLDIERETLHIVDDKSKIALIDYDTINETTNIRYQLTNHLGSASLELDQNGAIISYEEYHPFGTSSYRSGRNATEVSLKRYKYVFKELDNETGLYYYGMRYYAPWIARFISVDPLQMKFPHLTPFQYASNDPIGAIDLDGAESTKEQPKSYTIQKGDTYWNLSKKFSVSVSDLQNWNPYSAENLPIGKTITVSNPFNENFRSTQLIQKYKYTTSSTRNNNAFIPPGLTPVILTDIAITTETSTLTEAATITLGTTLKTISATVAFVLTPFNIAEEETGSVTIPVFNTDKKPEEDNKYEYFYRAMSYDELHKTGGYITHTNSTAPFITEDLHYLLNEESFIFGSKNITNYDVIVRYKVPSGTRDYLWQDNVSLKNIQSFKNWQQIATKEGKIGIKLERGSWNYAFPGESGNIHFNNKIIGMRFFYLTPYKKMWGK